MLSVMTVAKIPTNVYNSENYRIIRIAVITMSIVETTLIPLGESLNSTGLSRSAEETAGLTESERIRSLLPEKFRDPQYYLAQRYLYLVDKSKMTTDEKDKVFNSSIDLLTRFDGDKRDSGVPSALHYFDAAIQLFGEYIPEALRPGFMPIDDLTIEHSSSSPKELCRHFSNCLGLADDPNFEILFNSVYLEGFKRLKDSEAKNSITAHLLVAMHDKIEDDPRVKANVDSAPEVKIEIEQGFGAEIADLVYGMSFLKSKYAQKPDYIFNLWNLHSQKLIILFAKGRDLFSNILSINELQDRIKDGKLKTAAERIKEKASEYKYYADLLLEARDPMSELIADLLFYLNDPDTFFKHYQETKYFRRNSYFAPKEIEENFNEFLATEFPGADCRKETPGIYRSWKRKNRRDNVSNRDACASQYIINFNTTEELNKFVAAMRYRSVDSGVAREHSTQSQQGNRNDFTEFYVRMESQYSLLFSATTREYEWIFSQFEDDIFGKRERDTENQRNLMERASQYGQTFTGVIEDDIQRLVEESGRSLIKIYVDKKPLWLPEESSVLDVIIRNIQVYGDRDLSKLKYLIRDGRLLDLHYEIFGEDHLSFDELYSGNFEIYNNGFYDLDVQALNEHMAHDVFKTRSAKEFVKQLIEQSEGIRRLT
jgi:hypothetical protein